MLSREQPHRKHAAWSIVALLMVVTMCLSDVINNAATALIMAPIGVGIALQMGVSPDPFLWPLPWGILCVPDADRS